MRTILFAGLAAACLLAGPAAAGTAPFRLDTEPDCQEREPDVASLPNGGLVAVWQQGEEPDVVSRPRIFARLIPADGAPTGTLPDPAFLVNGNRDGYAPEVAANAAGNFVIVWLDGLSGRVRSRAYGPSGAILGPERTLYPGATDVAVTATNDGGFAVAVADGDAAFLVRLDAQGQPQGNNLLLSYVADFTPGPGFRDLFVAAYGPSGVVVGLAFDDQELTDLGALAVTADGKVQSLPLGLPALPRQPEDGPQRSRVAVVANAAGRILVTWTLHDEAGAALRARLFGADRQPLGPAFEIDQGGAASISAPDAVANDVDGSGDFLVAWQRVGTPAAPTLGSIARIRPDGGIVQPSLQAWTSSAAEGPSLDLDEQGRLLVAWQTGDRATSGPDVATCYSSGLFARRLAAASDVLLLRDGRFEVRVHWTDHAGSSGEGRATRLTHDSGSFWFFGEENVELVVKVLDGRAVNGHYWVFYASLTDVEFTLEVTDAATGETRTYDNPAGRLASRADTAAFVAVEATDLASLASLASAAAPSFHLAGKDARPDGPCALDLQTRRPGLCLDNRFEVEVAWRANGATGDAQGVGLTGDSGYLWFFDPANIELVVKVLDGRGVNGHFWVFYGALSDVAYTVTVTDTLTGQVRTYHNPAGRLASRADTAAF